MPGASRAAAPLRRPAQGPGGGNRGPGGRRPGGPGGAGGARARGRRAGGGGGGGGFFGGGGGAGEQKRYNLTFSLSSPTCSTARTSRPHRQHQLAALRESVSSVGGFGAAAAPAQPPRQRSCASTSRRCEKPRRGLELAGVNRSARRRREPPFRVPKDPATEAETRAVSSPPPSGGGFFHSRRNRGRSDAARGIQAHPANLQPLGASTSDAQNLLPFVFASSSTLPT